MRHFGSVVAIASALFCANALAAPGYLWEIGMEMEGMPFAMPKQKVCTPKASKEPPLSRDDDECRTLEKKMTGNRFHWKAQCKDGLMVGDITSTPTSYQGAMKMTENGGRTMSMKIAGKRLGECDYQDRSAEVLALAKQSQDMLAEQCQTALNEMQGRMMGSQCPKETPIYCKRIATLEGFDRASRNLPLEYLNDPNLGIASLTQACKLDSAKLLPKLCAGAVTSGNFAFVSRLCPAERPKLCAKAAAASELAFVSAHCPDETLALMKQHCEGRRYSSQIDPQFRAFCEAAASGEAMPMVVATPENNVPAEVPATPSESSKVDKIQKGIKQIRGLFGF